jgi:DNA repair protein RadC
VHPLACSTCDHAGAPAPAERTGYAEARARAQLVGPVRGPVELYYVLEPLVRGVRIELAIVVLFDDEGRVEHVREIARGDCTSVEVPIGRALGIARRARARYFALAHNHPSGDPWPSNDDANLTHEAERAAAARGFLLLDHLVLGDGSFYSFREGDQWTIRS